MRFSLPDVILYEIFSCYPHFSKFSEKITSEDLQDLVGLAKHRFDKDPILLKLPAGIHVVGDIHGNAIDLLRIFEKVGYPPEQKFLFLGDYVDRGINSIEVLCLLLSLKVQYPDCIYMLRGNHETRSISMSYGFLYEVLRKYNDDTFRAFIALFTCLPIAAVINDKYLCVHGGISPYLHKLSDISDQPKPGDIITDRIISDILWSDPNDRALGFAQNSRGSGCLFNSYVLDEFLRKNGLEMLIRSHELCQNGHDYPFELKNCLTVFSNTDYCGKNNLASILYVDENMEIDISTISPLTSEERENVHFTAPKWLLEEMEKRNAKRKQIESFSPLASPTSSPIDIDLLYM